MNHVGNFYKFLLLSLFFINVCYAKNPGESLQIAIGKYAIKSSNDNLPLVLIKNNSKGNWRFIKNISGVPEKPGLLTINSVSCVSKGDLCAAVGFYYQDSISKPLLLRSIDKGASWDRVENFTEAEKIKSGVLRTVRCTDKACIVAGYAYSETGEFPLMLTSSDGLNWLQPKITSNSNPLHADISAISCSEEHCIAVGDKSKNFQKFPLLLRTFDSGATWNEIENISNIPKSEIDFNLTQVSCKKNTCIATGTWRWIDSLEKLPLFLVSHDRGETWTFNNNLLNLPDYFVVEEVSALNDEGNAVLISGAYSLPDDPNKEGHEIYPLLLISHDYGETWYFRNDILMSSREQGKIQSIHCNNNQCIAVGYLTDSVNDFPLLLKSFDGGLKWLQMTNLNKEVGQLSTIQCKGPHCMIAGSFRYGGSLPYLLESDNGKLNFKQVGNIEDMPNNVQFAEVNDFA